MKKYLKCISIIMLVSIILSACGTGGISDSVSGGKEPEKETITDELREDIVTSESVFTDLQLVDGKYIYTLINITEHDVHLTFSSSQEYEYKLFDSEGKHIYTYSMDKMFLTAVTEMTLAPNEKYVMEVDVEVLTTLEKGTYRLEIWSMALESEGLTSEIEIIIN